MAREGTRSSTGNSKPRVFETVDTAPAISRKPRAKTTTKKAGAKPTGVTKKAGRPKKEGSVVNKARENGQPKGNVVVAMIEWTRSLIFFIFFIKAILLRDIHHPLFSVQNMVADLMST